MEKILEALAKARSDKAFRDHHPVADMAPYRDRNRAGSNDAPGTAEEMESPVPRHQAFSSGQSAIPLADEQSGAIESETGLDEDGLERVSAVTSHPVAPMREEVKAKVSEASSSTGYATNSSSDEVIPKPFEEPETQVLETVVARTSANNRRMKPLVITVIALGVISGLIGIYFFLFPLEDFQLGLILEDAGLGKEAFESVVGWADRALELVVKILGAPEN